MSNVFWGMNAGGMQRSTSDLQAQLDARDAKSQARRAESGTQELERRLDKLTLICMAVWSFVSEKTGVTEEQLMERVKKIDLMDGVADGKLHMQVAKCSACGRVMAPRHSKCIYCGADRLQITAFDDVL